MIKALSLLILAMFISSCGVLSEAYKKPVPPIPAEWNTKTIDNDAPCQKQTR